MSPRPNGKAPGFVGATFGRLADACASLGADAVVAVADAFAVDASALGVRITRWSVTPSFTSIYTRQTTMKKTIFFAFFILSYHVFSDLPHLWEFYPNK